MKPILLEICGWGPYSGKEVIDFGQVHDGGIFLITGQTGAGKTTIFDALCYALYGEVSGNTRTKDSLRSDFCQSDTKTYVKLIFTHKGNTYEIQRNPKYKRPKKKGGVGETTTTEEASLFQDDLVVTGALKVTKKVIEILAIDYFQFKQISMIAQGEFLKLLVADSGDRVDVFRNIFNTQIYQQIQVIAGEEARSIRSDIKIIKDMMKEAASNLISDNQEKLINEGDNQQFDTVISMADEEYNLLLAKEDQLKQLLAAKDKQKKEQLTLLNKAKQYNEVVNQIKELKVQEEKNSTLITIEEKQRDTLNSQRESYDKYKEEIQKELGYLNLFEEYEKLNKLLQGKKEAYETILKLVNEKEKKIAGLELSLQERRQELSKISDVERKLGNLKVAYEKLVSLEEVATNYLQKYQTCMEVYGELKILQKEYEEAQKARDLIRESYENQEKLYRRSAIGIAAKYLVEGEPCPVCGSCAHPNKAQLANEEPLSENQLQELKESLENKNKIYNDLYALGKQKQGSFTAMKNDLDLIKKQWADNHTEPIETVLTSIKEQKNQMTKDGKTLEKQLVNGQKITISIQGDEGILVPLKDELKEETAKSLSLGNEYSQALGVINSLKEKLPNEYSTKHEVEQSITKKQTAVRDYENQIRENADRLSKHNISLENTRTLLQDKQQSIDKEGVDFDISKLQIEMEELDHHYTQLSTQKEEIAAQLTTNKNAIQSLKDKWLKQKQLEEVYGVIGDLEQILNGKNQYFIKLEQYVLATYFDDILVAANRRFDKMSGGRYELLRVEKVADARSRNSLDIEVLDNYTGKKRSVKSLSGGESFKAALALALGLSDIIQINTGGIEIDVLFIDEGFGSLDDESIQQAINALLELTQNNRLIGIISHVGELKERIERQILVEKTNSGSRICSYLDPAKGH